MIELEHIHKQYGASVIIEEARLELKAGEITLLQGPSGCGKTTLLEIAAGLIPPDSGERVCQAQRIGCVFQDDLLLPWLDARQNLEFSLTTLVPESIRTERIDTWLERTGLTEHAQTLPADLSGGMRRRLNLARALAIQPDLLLLDEPFAFLDTDWKRQTAGWIGQATTQGAAVLIVTHETVPGNLPTQHSHQVTRPIIMK